MAMAGHLNWKFGIQAGQDQVPEEVVLRIQGIVCSRDLLPIQILKLRNRVTISVCTLISHNRV